jgi:hypothetical protein
LFSIAASWRAVQQLQYGNMFMPQLSVEDAQQLVAMAISLLIAASICGKAERLVCGKPKGVRGVCLSWLCVRLVHQK